MAWGVEADVGRVIRVNLTMVMTWHILAEKKGVDFFEVFELRDIAVVFSGIRTNE